jgi:hypothetical protein
LTEELVNDPVGARENVMDERLRNEVSIGKFDLLATYTYAKALAEGSSDDETKQKGRQSKRAWSPPSWEPRFVRELLTGLVTWSGANS